jgi:hypothetical protein
MLQPTTVVNGGRVSPTVKWGSWYKTQTECRKPFITSSPSTILNWIVSTLEAASGTVMHSGVVMDYCK